MARTLRQRFEVLVDVVTGRSRREVDSLGDEFDQAARKAGKLDEATDKVGGTARRSVGGNAVGALRDFSGPLGEVSTQVGDFGDSFAVVGEQAAVAFGVGEQAAGKMVTALGLAGAAVGGLAAVWSTLRDAAKKAREEVDAYAEAVRAAGSVRGGVETRLADKLSGRDALALSRLGISFRDLVQGVTTGQGLAFTQLAPFLGDAGLLPDGRIGRDTAAILRGRFGKQTAEDIIAVYRILTEDASRLRQAVEEESARARVGIPGAAPTRAQNVLRAVDYVQNITVYTPRAGDPVETVDLTNRYVRTNGQNRGGAVAP